MPTSTLERTGREIPAARRVRIPWGKRRFGAAIAVVLLLVVGVLAAVLPLGGTTEEPAATGAAAIVPADALAYVNLSIDGHRPAVRRALALAARFPDYPLLSRAVITRVDAMAGGSQSVDFARDIRPWLGKEAAIALLNATGSTTGSLIVLDVSNRRLAQAFLSRSGAAADGFEARAGLWRYPSSGTELAFVLHYLVLGQDASVRAAIDVAHGKLASLQSNAGYQRAAGGEPADRVLDAYAPSAGLRRLLEPRGGAIGALGTLLSQPALTGVTVSVSAVSGGARVRVNSALDPSLVGLSGTAPSAFAPTLQRVIPAGSTLMLDVTGLARVAPQILNAGAAAGVAGRIGPLLRRLGTALSAEGVNLKSITSIFDGETAVAVSGTTTPALLIVARTHDEASTRATLASLELPLEQLFPAPSSGPGQAPLFNDRQVGAITVHQLDLAPGLQLDYAVFDGLVVVSTSLDAIAGVAARTRSLGNGASYRGVLGASPNRVTSLLFLDFSQLLSLGEQTGLTHGARYEALKPDLQKIRAVGLHSTRGEADSTAELFLQIP